MGQVSVRLEGSFEDAGTVIFSAAEGGHAFAIQRAIEFLVSKLPAAIRRDHLLHTAGTFPPNSGYGKLQARKKGESDDGDS